MSSLLRVLWPQNDLGVIRILLESCIPSTHAFHVPWGEIEFTPINFVMLNDVKFYTSILMKF